MSDEALDTLVALRNRIEKDHAADIELSTEADLWRLAKFPGVPPPADPYGDEISVDTGGRCPIDGSEQIVARYLPAGGYSAGDAAAWDWNEPITFRRRKAKHPGKTYFHGKMEIVLNCYPDIRVGEHIAHVNAPRGHRRADSVTWDSVGSFARWLGPLT